MRDGQEHCVEQQALFFVVFSGVTEFGTASKGLTYPFSLGERYRWHYYFTGRGPHALEPPQICLIYRHLLLCFIHHTSAVKRDAAAQLSQATCFGQLFALLYNAYHHLLPSATADFGKHKADCSSGHDAWVTLIFFVTIHVIRMIRWTLAKLCGKRPLRCEACFRMPADLWDEDLQEGRACRRAPLCTSI